MIRPKGFALACLICATVFGSLLAELASAQSFAPIAAGAAASYDAKPWLEDLDQTREVLATKYANLEWVVLERETKSDGSIHRHQGAN